MLFNATPLYHLRLAAVGPIVELPFMDCIFAEPTTAGGDVMGACGKNAAFEILPEKS